MRHAHAAPDAPDGGDFARPLSAEGLADAGRVGRRLRDAGLVPDVAFVSAARRTRETAEAVFGELGRPGRIEVDRRWYDGGPASWTDALQALPDTVGTVLCVGHNPTVSTLAAMLTGTAAPFAPATAVVATFGGVGWERLLHPSVDASARLFRPDDVA